MRSATCNVVKLWRIREPREYVEVDCLWKNFVSSFLNISSPHGNRVSRREYKCTVTGSVYPTLVKICSSSNCCFCQLLNPTVLESLLIQSPLPTNLPERTENVTCLTRRYCPRHPYIYSGI